MRAAGPATCRGRELENVFAGGVPSDVFSRSSITKIRERSHSDCRGGVGSGLRLTF